MASRAKFDPSSFVSALLTLERNVDIINKATYTKGDGLYGKLCEAMGVENTLNARKKYYSNWKRDDGRVQALFGDRLLSSISCTNSEWEVPQRIPEAVQISTPSFRACNLQILSRKLLPEEMNGLQTGSKEEKNETVRKMLEVVSNPCVPVKKSESRWRWYFVCKHKQCRHFIVIVTQHVVTVFTNSETVYHASGNSARLHTLTVLKKAKAEWVNRHLMMNNEVLTICNRSQKEMKDKKTRFIQFFANPFQVLYFYYTQINIVLGIGVKEGLCPVLHFDCTGSVVRKPAGVDQSIYLYSGIVSYEKKIIPCFDFLSCEHSQDFLDTTLRRYKAIVQKHTKCWPIFSAIVTGYCLDSLQSLIQVFNGTSLFRYINWTFDVCNNLSARQADHIFILCCSHFIKMASRDVQLMSTSNDQKNFNITVISKIVNATTYAQADGYIQAYLKVISAKCWTSDLLPFLNIFRNAPEETIIDDFSIENNKEGISNLYARSKYYKKYNELIILIEETNASQQQSRCKANPYYNLKWRNTFLVKYLSILPLWSSFMNPGKRKFSNAIVENNFRHIKHEILGGATNLKATLFLEKIEPRHSALQGLADSLRPFYKRKV